MRELWSHEFLDALALEQCRETARRIEQDHSLSEVPRENIRRWVARNHYHPGEVRALREWEELLKPGKLDQLLRVMSDPGEEATRMRQSSPFAGILSNEERERITDRVIATWTRDEPQ